MKHDAFGFFVAAQADVESPGLRMAGSDVHTDTVYAL